MSTSTPRVLAVDIGTSSVRAMVFDAEGKVAARAQIGYPTVRPAPGQEEQDAELVRTETWRAIRACLAAPGAEPGEVRAIGFSSQMYGVFPVDGEDRPLGRSILWSDGRAEAEAARLAAEGGGLGRYAATGCPPSSIYPVAKLAWLRAHRPEVFAAARRFVSVKEYVTRPLTGAWAVDHSMASSTGLLDIRTHRWDAAALAFAGVGEEQLSRPVSGLEPFALRPGGPLAGAGLPDDVQVFLGGGDGPLANLGAGASAVGAVDIDLGTSGAARCTAGAPTTDAAGSLWCFCLTDELWAYGGIVTNVGNAYQWLGTHLLERAVAEDEAYERMNRLAAEAGPGAGGLHFVPYLRPVRSPWWDARLRGTMYGLGPDHGAGHVARALLEAVAFDLRAIVDLMAARVAVLPRLLLTGGLSRSPVMPQLLADVLGRELAVPEQAEGSIAGAALMALRGCGALSGLAFAGGRPPARVLAPDPAHGELYARRYGEHRRLVAALREAGVFQETGGAAGGARP